MKDYYEERWRGLPDKLAPEEFEARRRFLLAEVRRDERVLDLGCGDGAFTALIAQAGAVPIGCDVAQAALERARSKHPELDFRLAAIDQPLPFADNGFDVVWASEVIEHVADTARWLSEIRRVLVPRGRLLLSTPSHGRLRVVLRGIERFSEPLGDHLHLYTRRSLRRVLEGFAFGPIEIRAVSGPPLMRRMLLARAIR